MATTMEPTLPSLAPSLLGREDFALISGMVPEGSRVLDVGCGRGQLGQALIERGYEVWGIESSSEALATAQKRLTHVIDADCTDPQAFHKQLAGEQFDVLIFSDVLEHLYDPRTVLETYLTYLKPGGRVAISVPYAVAWSNRLLWCLGRVEYSDTGIMDRTHVRFFTFATACRLLKASGLTVERVDCTPHLVRALLPAIKNILGSGKSKEANPRALIDSPLFKLYQRFVYPVELFVTRLWKSMFAFRIIVLARSSA